MNEQRPNNEPTTSEQQAQNSDNVAVKQLIFALQGYGSEPNYEHKVIAIPYELQREAGLRELCNRIERHGWLVQVGIIK